MAKTPSKAGPAPAKAKRPGPVNAANGRPSTRVVSTPAAPVKAKRPGPVNPDRGPSRPAPLTRQIVEDDEDTSILSRKAARDIHDDEPAKPRTGAAKIASTPGARGKATKEPVPKGKAAKVLAEWSGPARDKQLDVLAQAMVESARQKHKLMDVMITGDIPVAIGLPWPSLMLEYVFQIDIIPFGCIISLMGQPGTCKSALLFAIMRIFGAHAGLHSIMEHESKFSPSAFRGIVKPYHRHGTRFACERLEDVMSGINHTIDDLRVKCDGTKTAPGPGRIIPLCVGVDSWLGKAARGTEEKIEKAGFATRSFPEEALLISSFLKVLPNKLQKMPVTVVGTHHDKPKKDDYGNTVHHTAGGSSVNFHETFRILVQRASRNNFEFKNTEGVELILQCTKDSLAPTGAKASTRYYWTDKYTKDPETGDPKRNRSYVWDWGWATTRLLIDRQAEPDDMTQDILKIGVVAKAHNTNAATCKALGVKDPISWTEMGNLIHQDAKIMNNLREVLGIECMQHFKPNVDYRKQLRQIQAIQP